MSEFEKNGLEAVGKELAALKTDEEWGAAAALVAAYMAGKAAGEKTAAT